MHSCVNSVVAREAHSRLGTVIKRSHVLVYEVDAKGLVRYMSPNAPALIGECRLACLRMVDPPLL